MILSTSGFKALVDGVALLEAVINARRNDQPLPSVDEITTRLQAVSAESATSDAVSSTNSDSTSISGPTRWQFEFTPTAELAERGVNVNTVRARLQELGQLAQAKPAALTTPAWRPCAPTLPVCQHGPVDHPF